MTAVTEPTVESSVPAAPTAPPGTPNSTQYTTGIYSSPPFPLKVKGWNAKICPKPKNDGKSGAKSKGSNPSGGSKK